MRFSNGSVKTASPHFYDEDMNGVRVDKWLWAARFFKTRSLASKACELGRIACNGQPVKASREIHPGDVLNVRNASGDFEIHVAALSEMRGRAPLARTLYMETDQSQALRQKAAEERKAMPSFERLHDGKPSKRNRRQLNRLRGRA